MDLKQFRKANKVYRLKLAQRMGFKTIEEADNYLQYIPLDKKTIKAKNPPTFPQAKPTIHLVNIVDRSGSMGGSKIHAANVSVQKDIELVKFSKEVNYTYTLIAFDDEIVRHFFLTSPDNINAIPSFRPGGATALYQAVGETLLALENVVSSTEKVIVTIITDGAENASTGIWNKGYNGKSNLNDLISRLEKKGFTITFIGTEYDVKSVIKDLGIRESNTVSYDGTGVGLGQTFALRSASLESYSKSVLKGEDVSEGFYKKKGVL